MANNEITADNVKDVALKSLLKKAEKFLKTMTEFQMWYKDEVSKKSGELYTVITKYNGEAHEMLCTGLRNLYKQDKTPDYNDQRNKDRIGKILMCMRPLANKLKDHTSICAVKDYITISSDINNGLDAMRKHSNEMAIFFATERPASKNDRAPSAKSKPNLQQGRPKSSSNRSGGSKNKPATCQTCATLKRDNEMKRSTITQLEKKVKDSERMTRNLHAKCHHLESENTKLQECLDQMSREKDQKALLASFSSDRLLQTKTRHMEDLKETFEEELNYKDKMIQHMREEITHLTDR